MLTVRSHFKVTETEGSTETETERHRQTDRQTETERQTETVRQTEMKLALFSKTFARRVQRAQINHF